jgi:hypothetical protein
VTAGEALLAANVDPARIAPLITPVVPDRVRLRPAPSWLRAIWGKDIEAMTLRSTIFVNPRLLSDRVEGLGPLLVHELVHARQWRQLGVARFLLTYAGQYLRLRLDGASHRDAYLGIGIEVEARDISRQFT